MVKLAPRRRGANMGAMPSREMLFNLLKRPTGDGAEAAFRHEIVEEQAAALGRMGRKAEAALAALKAHEGEGRGEVLRAAADAVWCFFVQREVMGLRDRARIVADYDIPREVMARLGAR
ncbi:MAG: hypothetical protein JWR43_608 [Phenylobacterium sp.]|jgi:hypothetical protein|nr:hypothetical protein [Phenylobacterium sp.]